MLFKNKTRVGAPISQTSWENWGKRGVPLPHVELHTPDHTWGNKQEAKGAFKVKRRGCLGPERKDHACTVFVEGEGALVKRGTNARKFKDWELLGSNFGFRGGVYGGDLRRPSDPNELRLESNDLTDNSTNQPSIVTAYKKAELVNSGVRWVRFCAIKVESKPFPH